MPYTQAGTGYRNTDTSRQAALDIEPGKKTIKQQIIDLLASASVPLTADEIADIIRRPHGSVRPRMTELQLDGKVRDSGSRKLGRYGKPMICWWLA